MNIDEKIANNTVYPNFTRKGEITMFDSATQDTLYGVGCDVMTCKYYETGNQCCAESITVESPTACKKTETFCGTFVAKA
jgi:hypothetical protein